MRFHTFGTLLQKVVVTAPPAWAVLFAGVAFAAAGEEPPGAMDVVYQGINLAVLLGIIYYFARKPIARFFSSTAREARETYQATRRAAEEAAAALETQKTKIAGLETELKRMVEAARADAETERKQLSEEAEAQAERIRGQARLQIEQEMNKARAALREQLADEAVRLAEEIIRGRMDAGRREGLVTAYIDQLGDSR